MAIPPTDKPVGFLVINIMVNIEEKLKASLNEEQFKAATHIQGPAIIMAGAGSGKTHTLMSRVGYLVSLGCDPRQILMLTFTNAAADEMKNRAASSLDSRCGDIVACTYHKFCNMMLRQYGERIGVKNYTIIGTAEMKNLIEYVKNSDDSFKNLRGFPPAAVVASIISASINKRMEVRDVLDDDKYQKYAIYKDEITWLIGLVSSYCFEQLKFTYDDLLMYMNRLLDEPDICKKIAGRYQFIMIDEFQDTNDLQEEIILKLAKHNNNIVVVGDISQSIYAFRGANVRNLQNFGEHFDHTVLFVLNKNYRSTQEILDAANAVMNKNVNSWTYYDMKAVDKTGEKPMLVRCDNAFTEARYIFTEIQRMHDSGVPYSDIAILERSSMSSFTLENMLTQNGIAFNKVGGMKFMDYECIGDMLAYFSVAVNPHDLLSWFRILQLHPNIGSTYAKKIADGCANVDFLINNSYKKRKFYSELVALNKKYAGFRAESNLMSLFDKIRDFYFLTRSRAVEGAKMKDDTRQEALDKIENDKAVVAVLRKMAEKYNSVVSFVDDIVLDSATNDDEDVSTMLTISTVHGAKGLEWSVVFILDCVEGSFPGKVDPIDYGTEKDEEELRCFYVAMTRAKTDLRLMIPEYRMSYSGPEPSEDSHYLRNCMSAFETVSI